ncbi:MAG: sigma 54-interacting transcriptional regulator [Myxococcota bacterium]|nr:sigma 54-interacting transcriptional regulator [Myxococcota bacterium]
MVNDDETIDPVSRQSLGLVVPRTRPWITIAFHPNIRRIGEYAVLPEPTLPPQTTESIVFGRNAPLFENSTGQQTGLVDPCLSRSQFTLRWHTKTETFDVRPTPTARRAVTAMSPEGDRLRLNQLPVGSLLNVGDRVCLILGARPFLQDAASRLGLVGEAPVMWTLRERIRSVAASVETALITGPTGSGKEVVAQAIHGASPRRNGPFVSVNCAALAPAVVESELFGHRRGAFTGADQAHGGLFRAAEGGTLFLDEIGEMSLSTQAKMLRVLQEKQVRPVGEVKAYPIDVRVIAATNRNLEDAVEAGHFREDLLARLLGLTVQVPPMASRRADVPLLFFYFLNAQLDEMPDARPALWRDADADAPPVPYVFFEKLLAHQWRRNAREIHKTAIDTATSNHGRPPNMFQAPELSTAQRDEPTMASSARHSTSTITPPTGLRPAEIDDETILRVMAEHHFVQKRVAAVLGISRTSLDKRLQVIGLPRPHDLSLQAIRDAVDLVGPDLVVLAQHLKVSLRGLKLRLNRLGVQHPTQLLPSDE